MPFACCLACGNVVSLSATPLHYGKPAGPCPKCRGAMYSAAVPFPELVARQVSMRAQAERGALHTP
jgi:hypothetical protein